jgi:hypothetical protein
MKRQLAVFMLRRHLQKERILLSRAMDIYAPVSQSTTKQASVKYSENINGLDEGSLPFVLTDQTELEI